MELIKEAIYPLAYGQRHLVQNYESDPKNAYPLHRVYKLQNDFNQEAFKTTMQYLINKHPSLRLRLHRTDSGWRQQFIDQTAPIVEHTVRGLTKAFRKQYGLLLIGEDIKPAINLEKDSPIRLTIFKINKQYYLSLCISHIAIDGTSFGLLEHELLECYQKTINGNLIPCSPSESFQRFILNETTYKLKAESNLKYWYDNLAGIKFMEIPIGKKINVVAGNYVRLFTNEEFEDFKEISTGSKYSGLTIIATIHLLLMHQSSKINDTILAIPSSNRTKNEDSSIIANIFVPMLVRFRWDQEDSITAMLDNVRETLLNAFIHSQFDSRKVFAFIRENNGIHNLAKECNFIIEDNAIAYPNTLFEYPLDTLSTSKMVSIGGFHFFAKQRPDGVLFKLCWDKNFWSINENEMHAMFTEKYNQISAAIYHYQWLSNEE